MCQNITKKNSNTNSIKIIQLNFFFEYNSINVETFSLKQQNQKPIFTNQTLSFSSSFFYSIPSSWLLNMKKKTHIHTFEFLFVINLIWKFLPQNEKPKNKLARAFNSFLCANAVSKLENSLCATTSHFFFAIISFPRTINFSAILFLISTLNHFDAFIYPFYIFIL